MNNNKYTDKARKKPYDFNGGHDFQALKLFALLLCIGYKCCASLTDMLHIACVLNFLLFTF